jgi:hypothetical protein
MSPKDGYEIAITELEGKLLSVFVQNEDITQLTDDDIIKALRDLADKLEKNK